MNREDFSLLKEVIYLDSAASSLKPKQVINEIVKYYEHYPINAHSVDSKLGSIVIQKIKNTRELVSDLIDANLNEIIFTSGTTDSINRLTRMFEDFIKEDDEIVISSHNHTSNFIPWVQLAQRKKAKIIVSNDLLKDINKKTKIVAFAQMNNTISSKDDIDKIYNKVVEVGALLVNDAAQAITYEEVSFHNCDVIVFSGTKIYGPTGIGVLAIKKELLILLKPKFIGGGSVINYDEKEIIFKEGIKSFEGGTQNIAGIIGLGEAIKYFNKYDNIFKKQELSKYAFSELSKVDNIELISKKNDNIILFKIKNISSQDVVSYLGHRNIILRAGKHCAIYLFNKMNIVDSIRMSFGLYNIKKDIDDTIQAIKEGGDFIDVF